MSIMPEGVKVYFGENLKKRIALEKKVRELFEEREYNYIELPIYEYYSDIEDNFSNAMKAKMFKMVDRDTGELLALRPDMTSLLAKLIKLKKYSINNSEKIYYIGKVFRYEKVQTGTYREVLQAGIEYIGGEKVSSDVEVISIALDTMKKLGLKNPKIEIGDVRIFNAIFEKLNMTKEEIWQIKDVINKKDIPELKNIVANKKYNEILLKLPLLIGGKEILNDVESIYKELGIESEITELRAIVSKLDTLGYSENYILDMGLLKEMEYYTGIVFNGLAREFGSYILSGGRYDKLMGTDALGFALNLDAAVEASSCKDSLCLNN